MSEALLKEALSDEMYYKYQQREDAIREENTRMSLSEKRGEKRKAKAIAKEMLLDGVDIKFIAKYTKLTVDEIKNLKSDK